MEKKRNNYRKVIQGYPKCKVTKGFPSLLKTTSINAANVSPPASRK